MPDITHLITIVEEQHAKVRALAVQEITEVAEDIAYYSAMIDAAEDDPLNDREEHYAMLAYLKKEHKDLVEHYQSLVNSYL